MLKTFTIALLALAACDVDDTNLGFSHLDTPRTRWAITVPGAEPFGNAVAIDSTGDVIGVGAIDNDGFVTKRVASDGSERWTHRYSHLDTDGRCYVSSVAVDAQDNIVVTGSFAGRVDFAGQTLSAPLAWATAFVAKHAPNGDLLWLRTLGGTGSNDALALLIDETGQIIVSGAYTGGTAILAGTTYTTTGGYVLALDTDGHEQWARVFEGAIAWFLASAPSGDVLVSGQFSHPTSVGGAVLSPLGRLGTYVSRFHPDGTFVASRALGIQNGTSAYGWLNVHPGGPIVVQTLDQSDVLPHQSNVTMRALDEDLQDLWQESTPNGEQHRLMSSPAGLFGVTLRSSPYNADHPETMEGHGEVVRFDANGNRAIGEFGELITPDVTGTGIRDAAANATGLAFIGEHTGTWDFGTGPVTGNGDLLIVSLDAPAVEE